MKETESKTNGFIPKAIFILLLLFSLHFWDLEGIPFLSYTVENIITLLVCGYCFIMVIQKNDLRFRNAILLFLIGIIANSFAAYFNLDQNLILTVLSFSFYYFIILYFLLHYINLTRRFVENIVIIFGIIYSILFIIQYNIWPDLIFNTDVRTADNSLQLKILGHGFLMLAYFLVLNRFLLNQRLINILLAFVFFMVLLKCEFRTLIGAGILISVLMIIKHFRFSATDFLVIFFVALLFVGLLQTRGVQKILDNMITQTEGNIEEGDKYARRIDIEFYYKRYPRNISYFIVGGGRPAGVNLFNINDSNWEMNYNIVWVDIGLLGFYMVIGGITLLGLLWYTIKAIFIKLPRDALYLNFYFLYLLIVSFTNEEIYRDGIFTVQAVGLYLIDIVLIEKSESKVEKSIYETSPSSKK